MPASGPTTSSSVMALVAGGPSYPPGMRAGRGPSGEYSHATTGPLAPGGHVDVGHQHVFDVRDDESIAQLVAGGGEIEPGEPSRTGADGRYLLRSLEGSHEVTGASRIGCGGSSLGVTVLTYGLDARRGDRGSPVGLGAAECGQGDEDHDWKGASNVHGSQSGKEK